MNFPEVLEGLGPSQDFWLRDRFSVFLKLQFGFQKSGTSCLGFGEIRGWAHWIARSVIRRNEYDWSREIADLNESEINESLGLCDFRP